MENKQLDPQELLEKVLNISKEYAEKGQTIAEEKLNIPDEGPEREKMLDGLKKGAIASAVLVGLLGTSSGRKLTGTAIKIGGVAALGTAAFKGYKNWKNKQGNPDSPIHELVDDEASERSLLIIKAMVAAAYSDTVIDDEEQAAIKRKILDSHLPKGLFDEVDRITKQPMSAMQLADAVNGEAEATEVYMAARLLIDEDSSLREKIFLDDLVAALKLDSALVKELDAQIA